MDPSTFLSALLAIIVIDLVLAGDNAIVIALAARALPAHLQRRAIAWGALGAIGVRSLMTVVVVWLLKIPGLQLAGGLLLAWIAYRLLVPDEDPGDERTVAAATFWGAMRTIVVADAVMGLDNVLAVAGAAHGSYLLVVCGLVISVPIVVWGSTVVLKLVERYPGVVYLGAAVLVWTAAKMVNGTPWYTPGNVALTSNASRSVSTSRKKRSPMVRASIAFSPRRPSLLIAGNHANPRATGTMPTNTPNKP